MFMYAVKKPAVAAAAALGEDSTAVFCEGPGLLFASAWGEAPDAGITTAIFNVEKGDIHDGDRWFPGAGSIAEVVFDMPAPHTETKASDEMKCPVLEIDPGEIRAPYIVAKEAAAAAKRGACGNEGGSRSARL